jgi:hypothetical protein
VTCDAEESFFRLERLVTSLSKNGRKVLYIKAAVRRRL